jgi:hypothetical protein
MLAHYPNMVLRLVIAALHYLFLEEENGYAPALALLATCVRHCRDMRSFASDTLLLVGGPADERHSSKRVPACHAAMRAGAPAGPGV